jgi:hypothetical protein
MGNLNNLYISQSFQSLAHLGTNTSLVPGTMTVLQDGIGQSLNISFDGTNISSSGNIYAANITASVIDTGSFATTSSLSNLSASLTVTDNFLQSQINALDASGSAASVALLNAFTASQLTINSGYNTFTQSIQAEVDSLQAATSSYVTSAITASSLITASASGNTITFTKGNTSTFSVTVDTGSAATTIFEVVFTGENITKGDPLYISGSQGANPKVFKADASNPAKMPVTFVSNETIGVNNTTNVIVLGLIEGIDLTGYVAGQSIYVAEGGGWSASLPSGSNSITQLLGVVTKGGSGGKGLVLNPGPAQLPGLDTGKMWVGNGSNQPVEITTASFASSASFNSYTSSNDQKVNSLISATGSFATTGSNTFRGNQNNIGAIQAADADYGPQYVSPTVFQGVGSASVAFQQFINAGNYDCVHIQSNLNAGTNFQDLPSDTFVLNTWLNIPTNTGNNPKPIMTRGLVVTGSTEVGTFTSSLQQGHVFVGNASGRTTTVATSSFGTTINTGSFITTGSASTNSQTILGDFKFNTTYITSSAYTNQAGGTNILGIDYGDFNDILNYWGGLNFENITVNGTGVTNATIPSYNFGTYLELSLSSGTTTNGASYTLTGPVYQVIDVTGSISATQELKVVKSDGSVNGVDKNGLYSRNASGTIQANVQASDGVNIGENVNFDYLRLLITGSQNGAGSEYDGAQIVMGANFTNRTQFGFQGTNNYTDGTITAYQPLFVSSSLRVKNALTASLQQGYVWVGGAGNVSTLVATSSFGGGGSINTGSFAITGSNVFNGAQIVNNFPLQVSNYNEPNLQAVSPTVFQGVGTASVAYEQYINAGNYDAIHIQSNLNAGTDFQDLPSDTFVLNTWLNIPTNTGNNPAPQFKRGLSVTGSTNIQQLTASLQQGHLFVGNSSGRTTTVATSSFVSTNQTGSFALLGGSNIFTAQNTFKNQTRYEGSTQSDSFGNIQFVNNQSLVTSAKSTSYPGQTGSFQVMSMTTGSGGNASFQMTAEISGTVGQLKVTNNAGSTTVAGLADTILFAKNEGFPNTPATTFTAEATSIKLVGDVKVNKGSNKTSDIVTVNGTATISNSLVTSDSIILVTCQDRQNQADEYPPVVGNKGTGTFDIFTNVSTNMQVAYLIINPV